MVNFKHFLQKSTKQELVITECRVKKVIHFSDIIYLQRQKPKTMIYTLKGSYGVYEGLTEIEQRLGDDFLRISQSDIVRFNRIRELRKNEIILENGTVLTIGRTYQKKVRALFKQIYSVGKK